MPTISWLTLKVDGSTWSQVTLEVSYAAGFSPIEQFLAANGLEFEERVQIIGHDAAGAPEQVLHTFQSQRIPAPTAGRPVVARNRTLTVARSTLNEDPGTVPYQGGWGGTGGWSLPDADEFFARVEVAYIGLNPGSSRADSAVQVITA